MEFHAAPSRLTVDVDALATLANAHPVFAYAAGVIACAWLAARLVRVAFG